MDVRSGINTRLGESIVVASDASPDADAVFLSIDSGGNAGELNLHVLNHFDLGPSDLPTSDLLDGGYFIREVEHTLLCYVVTIDGRPPSELLELNLAKCLRDKRLQSLGRLWIPLMGTGTAGLSLVDSFLITLKVLNFTEWNERPGAAITISTPSHHSGGLDALAEAIERLVPSEFLAEKSVDILSRWNPSLAAQAVLSVARMLGKSKRDSELTTELLLFALASSTQTDAFDRLGSSRAAGAFASAIYEMAGDRYERAWRYMFVRDWLVPKRVEGGSFSRVTDNASVVLDRAVALAKDARRDQFIVDDLVRALLDSSGVYTEYLDRMEIKRSDLLEAYEDVLTGQVLMNLHNDAASTTDCLGYSAFAKAIASFLANPGTPAPLSISVQAPWGAGKSSLMQMIRERIDPEGERNAHRPKVGQGGVGALTLGSVLNFLEQKIDIGPDFWKDGDESPVIPAASSAATQPHRDRLVTIWFNAWKYESCEQVWAGLVDAIVSQIGDRLPIAQKEAFLLRLHLARIDDGIVRRKIYDRIFAAWWTQARRVLFWGGGAILSVFGLSAAKTVLPGAGGALAAVSALGYVGGVLGPVVLVAYLLHCYRAIRTKTSDEPAEFSLAPYLTVPDYTQSVGAIHQIHADLRRVLAAAPKEAPGKFSPIVIFIDDLDRCSPNKIASVVEGVSMLLASETYRCIFVIGMDPQVIAAALEKAHEEIRERLPSYERGVPLGWRFMDKFVQLPFTIPPQANLDEYLRSLGAGPALLPSKSLVSEGAIKRPSAQPARDEELRPGPAQDEFMEGGSRDQNDLSGRPTTGGRTQDDSRDVGRIIRELGNYSVGNPREIKRMINLARLYLALRNEKRRREPSWLSPSLDQYARWIALTLRWPDMMRWLQWGADEAVWTADDVTEGLIVRRLRVLEEAASKAGDVTGWSKQIEAELDLDKGAVVEWRKDPKLFEFFRSCSKLTFERRLSTAVEIGFW